MGKPLDVHEKNLRRWLQRETSATVTPQPLTGRLIIPLVAGLGYHTRTQQGVTSRLGEFNYLPGERVTFCIGDIELPAATTGPTVTPYDMGSAPHESLNAMRLLLLFASQRNIGRWPTAANAHCGSINFALPPETFARQPAVVRMVQRLGCTLPDEKSAGELLDQLIIRHIQGAYLEVAVTLWHNAAPTSAYHCSWEERCSSAAAHAARRGSPRLGGA
ncbi:MAG TPA: hypothetical protein VGE50_10855 [Gammaproteobacteria bacterium]